MQTSPHAVESYSRLAAWQPTNKISIPAHSHKYCWVSTLVHREELPRNVVECRFRVGEEGKQSDCQRLSATQGVPTYTLKCGKRSQIRRTGGPAMHIWLREGEGHRCEQATAANWFPDWLCPAASDREPGVKLRRWCLLAFSISCR